MFDQIDCTQPTPEAHCCSYHPTNSIIADSHLRLSANGTITPVVFATIVLRSCSHDWLYSQLFEWLLRLKGMFFCAATYTYTFTIVLSKLSWNQCARAFHVCSHSHTLSLRMIVHAESFPQLNISSPQAKADIRIGTVGAILLLPTQMRPYYTLISVTLRASQAL